MLNDFTISELLSKLQSGETCSRDVMQAYLDRIQRVDARIGAFLSYDAEDALRQADETDQRRRNGDSAQDYLLLGIPVAIKDIMAVANQPLQCSSRILEGFISPYNATVIEKLKAAGAIVFGRLNMDEFAMGSSNENSAFQPTRNPWDTNRVPGGSSGGCAAAVAARECGIALGTDTGGSIRQPAAFCGCVGLKPTYGRVSRYGLVAFASSLDQIGPISRTVTDASLLLNVISGADPLDSTSLDRTSPKKIDSQKTDLRGKRLGLPKEFQEQGLDPEIRNSVDQAIRVLTDMGAEVVEISLPHTEYAIATYYVIATAEASANLARYDGIRYGLRVDAKDLIEQYGITRGTGFGSEVKRRVLLGTYVLSSGYYEAYYLRAQKVRTLIRRDFMKAFEKVDAIVSPTTPTAAFRIGEKSEDPLQMYLADIFTISCNLAGLCGISVPCGFTASPRLPIGFQLLGNHFEEESIMEIASAYQAATDWHQATPPEPFA